MLRPPSRAGKRFLPIPLPAALLSAAGFFLVPAAISRVACPANLCTKRITDMLKCKALAASALATLTACSLTGSPQNVQQEVQDAVVASSTVLTPAQLAAVEQLCIAASPGLATATGPTAPPSISGGAIYPAAYCADLLRAPPGMVPATTTSGTPAWLTATLQAVEVAAKIAGVVIPLLP